VTLLSDQRTNGLLRELGLEPRWVETKTGSFFDGQLYSISNALEFLRFPPLSFLSKFRLGLTILRGASTEDWRHLDQVPVEEWLLRWSGPQVYNRFWLPLLRAKLGDTYKETSAAFIWATIQRLYSARKSGLKKELFGYVPGGYARILDRLGEALAGMGVDIRLGSRVTTVSSGPVVETETGADRFDRVVVTAPAPIAGRLIEGLSEEYRSRLDSTKYVGIVCPSVLTKSPISEFYLTYLHDPAPFTAIVEMSAFVDREEFGGKSLLYLPKYAASDDPLFERSDDEIEEEFLSHLSAIHPRFDRSDVLAFRVSRARNVFPVSTLGRSDRVPPFHTNVPGVAVISSAQIVNGTLNVNETLEIADRGLKYLLAQPDKART
jgi:protoporphyrinogen oxidase